MVSLNFTNVAMCTYYVMFAERKYVVDVVVGLHSDFVIQRSQTMALMLMPVSYTHLTLPTNREV